MRHAIFNEYRSFGICSVDDSSCVLCSRTRTIATRCCPSFDISIFKMESLYSLTLIFFFYVNHIKYIISLHRASSIILLTIIHMFWMFCCLFCLKKVDKWAWSDVHFPYYPISIISCCSWTLVYPMKVITQSKVCYGV